MTEHVRRREFGEQCERGAAQSGEVLPVKRVRGEPGAEGGGGALIDGLAVLGLQAEDQSPLHSRRERKPAQRFQRRG